jgi:hypothetical protein
MGRNFRRLLRRMRSHDPEETPGGWSPDDDGDSLNPFTCLIVMVLGLAAWVAIGTAVWVLYLLVCELV